MKTPILQHYVPQFLLRNFQFKATNHKADTKIYVYDKSNSKNFLAPIKSTGGERYFYEVKSQYDRYSIEERLGVHESNTAPIIKRIIENKSLKTLTKKEKMTLSKFISLQFLRGPAIRNRLSELVDLLEMELNFFEENEVAKPTELENKRNHCEIVLNGVNQLSPFLYNKDWILCDSTTLGLIISDNPVVMHNTFDEGTGLRNEGVEVYMPISPRFSLLILCSSVRKRITESLEKPIKNPLAKPHIKNLEKYAHTFKRNGTLKQNSENVIFLNSLQVINSERFLYSQQPNFDLPNLMISKNEKLRSGTGRFLVSII